MSLSPDFTLTPATASVTLAPGGSTDDVIAIGRLGGSAGGIELDVQGALPRGIHVDFAPNPATGTTITLTLTADANAPPTVGCRQTVRIAGTPRLPAAGAVVRSFTLSVGIQPCAHVASYDELFEALTTGCKCIFVENDAEIDLAQVPIRESSCLPDRVLYIPEGVTLESGRSPTVLGGLLYMSRRLETERIMLDLGANTRVTGLRLRGYTQSDTTDRSDHTDGIAIRNVDGVLIDNNEIYGWPLAGVEVRDAPNELATAGRIRITGNFIHNNVQCGAGYGVVVGGSGFALIDRNVFNYNRHDVSDDGLPTTGYVAESNFVLTNGPTCGGFYNQHFDMHGTGGGPKHLGGRGGYYVEVRNNTIRGDQRYGRYVGHLTRPAFDLRGTPVVQARFIDNAVAHSDEDSAVRVEHVDRDALKRDGKLVVAGNRYDVNTATELAVGDFDGDGQADVFQATGTLWVYSPSGRREWQFLNSSFLRLDRLAFGDFNGDGKTDVFLQDGDQWLVSYGGTSAWQSLPAGSNIPMKYYRFGDFDGDGKTDIFRADGSRFYYSSGGATAWKPLAFSHLQIGDLRFGDFNGDGQTDVFSLADGQWSVSYSGAAQWQRLNEQLSSDLTELVFGDFDGDGRTDIARANDGDWEVSYGGSTPWQPLHRSEPTFSGMLFGDFDGDKRMDALQCGALTPELGVVSPLTRFNLSSGGVESFVAWSLQDML